MLSRKITLLAALTPLAVMMVSQSGLAAPSTAPASAGAPASSRPSPTPNAAADPYPGGKDPKCQKNAVELTGVEDFAPILASRLQTAFPKSEDLRILIAGKFLWVFGDDEALEAARAMVDEARKQITALHLEQQVSVRVPLEFLTVPNAVTLVGQVGGITATGTAPAVDAGAATGTSKAKAETNLLVLPQEGGLNESVEKRVLKEQVRDVENKTARDAARALAVESNTATGAPDAFTISATTTPGRTLTFEQFRNEELARDAPLSTDEQRTLTRARSNSLVNKVTIAGTRSAVLRALQLLDASDQPVKQVVVDARILELTPDAVKALGVNWQNKDNQFSGTINLKESNPTDLGRFGTFSRDGFTFSATVSALISRGTVRVRAAPSLVVQDRSSGQIFVGEQATFTSSSLVSEGGVLTKSVSTPAVAKSGVQLVVSPKVTGDFVQLDFNALINSQLLPPAITNTSVQFDQSARSVESSLRLPNNGMVAIGGLTSDEELRRTERVPVLGSIPLLKELFTNRVRSVRHTEFVVLLGVRILDLPPSTKQELLRPVVEAVQLDDRSVVAGSFPAQPFRGVEISDHDLTDCQLVTGQVRLSSPALADTKVYLTGVIEGAPDGLIRFKDERDPESPNAATLTIPAGERTARFSFRTYLPEQPQTQPGAQSQQPRNYHARVSATLYGESREITFQVVPEKPAGSPAAPPASGG